MVRFFCSVALFICLTTGSYAQVAKDLMVGASLDLAKTDNVVFGDKAQFGVEGNYFLTKSFAATLGADYWTNEQLSFVLGGRFYPVDDAFVRVRGLVGVDDLAIGGGWSKPLDDHWKFEATGDFYFSIDFAIRVGIVYIIRK